MDITKVFKATLKTVRLRRKDLERTVEISQASLSKQHHSSNTFHVGSTKVCHSISKLKNFLKDHRKDYIGEFSSVLGDITGMTEDERDQIDKDAQLFMRTCSGSISSLKREVLCNNTSGQLTTHRNAVIHLLENYLKDNVLALLKDKVYLSVAVKDTVSLNDPAHAEIATFSKEEAQMFEKENDALLNELNNIVDEVKQIEGKVVEISKLQEIFSEKILDQANIIEKAHETAVTTTENIKDGNENIREVNCNYF
eukprot:gene5771-6474_t